MDPLTRKKISRSALRNHCKKIEGKIDLLLAGDLPKDGIQQLKSLRLAYEAQLKKVSDADAEVVGLLPTEQEVKDDMEASLVLEDTFYGYLTKIDTKLDDPTSTSTDTKPSIDTPSASEPTIKLARTEPPSFDGNIMNWQSWWDQFDAAVHSNSKMAEVNKFWYLKQLLSERAKECISGLALTNDNYSEAITLLKERYGNKQLLINAFIENFEKLPKVKSMKEVKKLRIMYDGIESTIRNLKTLELDTETYGGFLTPLLSKKLPSELLMIMSRKFKNNVWNIKEMLDILKDELEAKERCTFESNNDEIDVIDYSVQGLHVSHNDNAQKSRYKKQHNPKNDAQPTKKAPKCVFCGVNGHSGYDCVNVTEPNARCEALKQNGRCFVCFQQGHRSGTCYKKNYQCRNCGKKHNIIICDSPRGNVPVTSNQQQQPSVNPTGQKMIYNVNGNFVPPQNQNFHPVTNCYQSTFSQFRHPQGVQFPAPQFVPITTAPAVQNQNVAFPAPQLVNSPVQPSLQNSVLPSNFDPNIRQNFVPQQYIPSTTCCNVTEKKSTLMGTACVTVCDPKNETISTVVRMLFDDGSQRTYVTLALKEKLNIPVVRKDTALVKGFGGVQSELKEVDVVKLKIRTLVGFDDMVIEAVVVPVVCAPIPNQNTKTAKEIYPHLQNLFLADYCDNENKQIDILLGLDFYWDIVSGMVARGEPGTPVACHTSVGWILSGVSKSSASQEFNSLTTISLNSTAQNVEKEKLKNFFDAESVVKVDSDLNKKVLESFKSSIQFNGEKYVVKLPEKDFHQFLPDNYWLAMKGLIANEKRFAKDSDPDLRKKYYEVFEEYKKNQMIERVSPSDVGIPGRVHYLMHRPIVREDRETTKIRPVFNASASGSGPSLNDCLNTGPNLLSMIYDILLKFRFHKIVIMSDIKQAFLNVLIHPDFVDMLRFLLPEGDTVAAYRFRVVLFGLTPSPFLLLATILFHCERMVAEGRIDQEFVDTFRKVLYMDDNITGCETVSDGFELYQKSKWLMKTGGFELRKWYTNNKELMALIDAAEAQEIIHPFPEENGNPKNVENSNSNEKRLPLKSVLGLDYDGNADEMIYDFGKIIEIAESMKTTRRHVLSVGSSFYDILGLIGLIVIQAKVIFQLICKEKVKWDAEIPEPIAVLWMKFLRCLKKIKCVTLPRYVLTSKVLNVQVHGFSDASGTAYCAVVYTRVETEIGVRVQLVTSKTKVAPLKKVSIPRLELLSCWLLARLLNSCSEILKGKFSPTSISLWNDSSSALGWIRGEDKRWSPWIEARVSKLRAIAEPSIWRHVPGNLNPADVATREISPDDVSSNSVWFNGPEFLRGEPETWPITSVDENVTLELKGTPRVVMANIACCTEPIIDIAKYSSLYRLYRVASFIVRFIQNCKAAVRRTERMKGDVTVSEYLKGKNIIIKQEQSQIRNDEKFALQKKSLNIFEDHEGILRVKGRLDNAPLEPGAKNPIFVRDSHFTHLLIRKAHNEIWHGGIEHTLTQLRLQFWLVRGKQIVSRTIYRCVVCKRQQGKCLLPPPSPSLPEFRVATEFCFQTTGVDFAGPLLVKQIYDSNGMLHKAYICLYTCAASRSIHLELVPDLEAESFIRSFKRFSSRRGLPSRLISDNGRTFTSLLVKSYLLRMEIDSQHILPASPWWGGFYERLVKSVKLPLKKVLGKARLSYEEMETMLIEVEGVVNCRPLTYLHDDEVLEPLTPSHLLHGRNISARSTSSPLNVDKRTPEELSRRVRYVQTTMQSYWQRFQHVYLATLREHHMYASRKRTNTTNVLKVGDVVIIKPESSVTPRSSWRLGRVDSLVVGKDGHVRGAHLKTRSNEGRASSISRPLQKLVPLEILPESINEPISTSTSPNELAVEDTSRPRREAALLGEQQRRCSKQK